ncbi:zinc carboxypeptidase A 1-like [Musca vetustissima]|uniref:zinc carboxypeptidase A 1-like n=1 Tax=Musca vetustissima TaxID=27455 RepID=UPI002AB6B34C|nr:zinc carboxypeptidase A 1-like [Musca vetustissima]
MSNIKIVVGFCLLLAVALCSGERARYDNYRVYKVTATNSAQLEVLKNLESASDSIIFLNGVHWMDKPLKIVVAPHKVADFLEILGSNEIEYQLLEANLQTRLDSNYEEVAKSSTSDRATSYDWTKYYGLEDTYRWLQQLAMTYPSVVTLIEGGKSYQGRSILGVKISKSKSEKPGIFIEAGIHAREWIAGATATYLINQLLTSQEESVKQIAENYNWYIFPHVNPDGFVYTHTTDRLWRKTRTPYGSCFGADPNRNWGFEWNVVGSSNSPCSDTYAGPSAFSEIETRSLSEYIKSLQGKIHLYISFHSYSQFLLYPYGHTGTLPVNSEDFKRVYDVSIAAIKQRYGTVYTGGNIYDAIYPASGGSIDWAYENVGTKLVFCYELRPSDSDPWIGFELPANQIIPTGEETVDSITAMVNEVEKLGYFKN